MKQPFLAGALVIWAGCLSACSESSTNSLASDEVLCYTDHDGDSYSDYLDITGVPAVNGVCAEGTSSRAIDCYDADDADDPGSITTIDPDCDYWAGTYGDAGITIANLDPETFLFDVQWTAASDAADITYSLYRAADCEVIWNADSVAEFEELVGDDVELIASDLSLLSYSMTLEDVGEGSEDGQGAVSAYCYTVLAKDPGGVSRLYEPHVLYNMPAMNDFVACGSGDNGVLLQEYTDGAWGNTTTCLESEYLGEGECRQANGEYGLEFNIAYDDLDDVDYDDRLDIATERCLDACRKNASWCMGFFVNVEPDWEENECYLVTDYTLFTDAGNILQSTEWASDQLIMDASYTVYCAGSGDHGDCLATEWDNSSEINERDYYYCYALRHNDDG